MEITSGRNYKKYLVSIKAEAISKILKSEIELYVEKNRQRHNYEIGRAMACVNVVENRMKRGAGKQSVILWLEEMKKGNSFDELVEIMVKNYRRLI